MLGDCRGRFGALAISATEAKPERGGAFAFALSPFASNGLTPDPRPLTPVLIGMAEIEIGRCHLAAEAHVEPDNDVRIEMKPHPEPSGDV